MARKVSIKAVPQPEKTGEAQFECQACCMKFTTKNKKKQHMKTEDHKTRYALHRAIEKRNDDSKLPRGPVYYMNRNMKNGFILSYDLSDKDAGLEAIRAGRINSASTAYCQMDETKILQVEQSMNYSGQNCFMIRIDSEVDVRVKQLVNYPGEARNYSTLCRASNNVAFLIGGLRKMEHGPNLAARPSLRYNVDLNEWHESAAPVVPRWQCSSCCVNGHVFIFCGRDDGMNFLRSIEKLRVNDWNQGQEQWQLIPDIKFSGLFTERKKPAVC